MPTILNHRNFCAFETVKFTDLSLLCLNSQEVEQYLMKMSYYFEGLTVTGVTWIRESANVSRIAEITQVLYESYFTIQEAISH